MSWNCRLYETPPLPVLPLQLLRKDIPEDIRPSVEELTKFMWCIGGKTFGGEECNPWIGLSKKKKAKMGDETMSSRHVPRFQFKKKHVEPYRLSYIWFVGDVTSTDRLAHRDDREVSDADTASGSPAPKMTDRVLSRAQFCCNPSHLYKIVGRQKRKSGSDESSSCCASTKRAREEETSSTDRSSIDQVELDRIIQLAQTGLTPTQISVLTSKSLPYVTQILGKINRVLY